MKCLVVGYGSIGERHVRILNQLSCRVAVVSKRDITYPLVYNDLEKAVLKEAPDYIIIANRTVDHYPTFFQLASLGYTGVLLVEKPLFHNPVALPTNSFKRVYVGYNLRLHPILIRLAEIISTERVLYAQAYVGQYLPDWRPKADYRSCYSSSGAEGGGVLRDLSHELDYLQWLLGDWLRLVAIGGKYSSLEITSEDMYSIMLSMEKCPMVQLHLNYLDKIGRREISLVTGNSAIHADLIANTLRINNEVTSYEVNRDHTYLMQHRAVINGDEEQLCGLDEGMAVLNMIKAIEESNGERRWVER